ncbi:SHQ1-domain-containing protein [Pluteus cervinus]|uniref:SHQ1-domain-containing protein n=1 Tax=Pluteus cervinus TaxID=181527 RepID=A0ACD3AEH8_9AGAR|nr:SHQ1-domain-containing protein [Pluteus cervinus]
MITPRFTCSQTPESLIVSVYCPSIRAVDVEINVDETLFTLHINPYFLRLDFSHPIVEDDASSARYDPSSGYLTVTLTKETTGQDFQDLDLLAKLLAPRENQMGSPLIEVVSADGSSPLPEMAAVSTPDEELVSMTRQLNLDDERQQILQAAENDWHLPQDAPEPPISLSEQKTYGFLGIHSGYFRHVSHTENEVNELGPDAETCTLSERRRRRVMHENDKWDPEYYMADFADDERIQELLHWKHPHVLDVQPFSYTESENMAMLRLPRREYLATPSHTRGLYLTLITLLFSYAYECRTTQCDPTPESSWTLGSLTPAFSALDPPTSSVRSTEKSENPFTKDELMATLVPSYRRALAFPLYRSFALAEVCQNDVACFLGKGKRLVVRCLLEMKDILDHHEVYYVYSKIWVDDFCAWAQACARWTLPVLSLSTSLELTLSPRFSDEDLISLGKRLAELRVEKESIGWGLDELEAATQGVEEREADSDDDESS